MLRTTRVVAFLMDGDRKPVLSGIHVIAGHGSAPSERSAKKRTVLTVSRKLSLTSPLVPEEGASSPEKRRLGAGGEQEVTCPPKNACQ